VSDCCFTPNELFQLRKGLTSGTFVDVAGETEILVSNENGRGIALSDLNNDDHLDIICGNWEGNHRIFLQELFKIVQYLVMECNCVRKITEGLFRKYSTL
jgi:hypothetical protein